MRGRRTTTQTAGLLAASLVATLAGCSDDGNETVVRVEPSPTPTASGSESGTASPSEPGSPTGNPGPSKPSVVETIASGLEAPWGLAFFPNGDAIFTERDTAKVYRISGPDHAVAEVGTIGEAAPQGEGGLMGVAISPEFAENRTLYFYVSTESDNRIVTARLEDGRLSRTTPIFTGIPVGVIHDGGRVEFGPDGMLYASTGETGDGELAQDKKSLGGKILRLTPQGKPAPGNPGAPLHPAVWSFGHRNVQGLAWVDDQLWASEFGQNDFDELNRIEAGANYGWPEVEGKGGTDRGFIDPQAVWSTDVASPSGLAYLDGALWMAALRGSRLWRIPVEGGEAAQPEAYFVGEYGRMRTVAVTPDGDLWVTTSNRDGRGDPAAEDDRILLVRP